VTLNKSHFDPALSVVYSDLHTGLAVLKAATCLARGLSFAFRVQGRSVYTW
jgi:hypothetical protein